MTVKKINKNNEIQKTGSRLAKSVNMLKSFGLSENEALIYTYLLERGVECGGTKIALGTGLHRQYIYIGIGKLIELELIETVQHGKQKKYKAVAPNQIEKIAKRKVFEAEDIVKELNTFSAVGREQDFEIFVGDKQVRDYEASFMKNLKKNEIQYVISGASKNFLDFFGNDYENIAVQGKKKNLTTYYIGGAHELEHLQYAQKMNPNFKYRILEAMPSGVTSTVIRQNSLVLYSLAKPPLIYIIRSEIISLEYKAYFDMLWKLAK